MTIRWTTHPIWKAAAPIMDECQECSGSGQCQVDCEDCGTGLTEANWTQYDGYVCEACVERELLDHRSPEYRS